MDGFQWLIRPAFIWPTSLLAVPAAALNCLLASILDEAEQIFFFQPSVPSSPPVLQEAVSTRDPELVRLVLRYRDYQRTAKRLAGIPVLLERLRQVGFHTQLQQLIPKDPTHKNKAHRLKVYIWVRRHFQAGGHQRELIWAFIWAEDKSLFRHKSISLMVFITSFTVQEGKRIKRMWHSG